MEKNRDTTGDRTVSSRKKRKLPAEERRSEMEKQERPGAQDILACETALILEEKEEKKSVKPPIAADQTDRRFAVIYAVLSFAWVYLMTSDGFAWKFSAFTAVYPVVVLAYLFQKKQKPAKESFFWLAVLLGSGIPYAFYTEMPVLQVIGTVYLGIYWTVAAAGCLMEQGRTSSWVAADSWNSLCVIPFANAACHLRILLGEWKETENGEVRTTSGIRKAGSVLLGLALSIPVLVIVLPMLGSADENFSSFLNSLLDCVSEDLAIFFARLILTVPVCSYLFGVAYGCVNRRRTDRIEKDRIRSVGQELHVLPDLAVQTAYLTVAVCYILFMFFQAKYLFSAFAGILAEMYTYAEYARKGFFELCFVAAFNLMIVFLANTFAGTKTEENRRMRWLNVLFAVLTLLLIATAMSKMLLYIGAYGLTVKRVQTMVFMVWLTVVFLLLILAQRRSVKLIRAAVMSGAGCYALLCILPLETMTETVNRMFF